MSRWKKFAREVARRGCGGADCDKGKKKAYKPLKDGLENQESVRNGRKKQNV